MLRQRVAEHGDRLRQPLGARSDVSARPGDHPAKALAPERHQQQAADADVAEALTEEVVERPAKRTGCGERLDFRNHAPNLDAPPRPPVLSCAAM